MISSKRNTNHLISPQLIHILGQRLKDNKPLRRSLLDGRLYIERQLPFLCVYRYPEDRWDAGTDHLVRSEASFLTASGDHQHYRSLRQLLLSLVSGIRDIFGSCLIIELWTAPQQRHKPAAAKETSRPRFRIVVSGETSLPSTVEALHAALLKTRIARQSAHVEIEPGHIAPPGLRVLLSHTELEKLGSHLIGLEVEPIHYDLATQTEYPMVRAALNHSVSRALKRAFYDFTCTQTVRRPQNYQVFGRRAFVKAVWETDRRLAEISDSFDMLIHLNPLNAELIWNRIKRGQCEDNPRLRYRPLPIDPALLKRRLFAIPIERIEDPVLAEIFREKRERLDRHITLLSDRGTSRFLYGSLQLFGAVDAELLRTAEEILNKVPSRTREDIAEGYFTPQEFARLARREVKKYRRVLPEFTGSVRLRNGIASLMVSSGQLLIGKHMNIPKRRAKALLQHEIGTHMVTYYNARSQPFHILSSGLAGYDELQEGLGVLAEYLCGGLSRPRLRILAARVVAVQRLVEGASFMDVYRELDRTHDFEQRTAFTITLRVFRGGGLTKDALYLRGLMRLMRFIQEGGDLHHLFLGKFAFKHVPVIQELLSRKVLHEAPLKPYYLNKEDCIVRLDQLRSGATVMDLVRRNVT